MANDDGNVQSVAASISGIPSRPLSSSRPPPGFRMPFRDDLDTVLARLFGSFWRAKSEEGIKGEPQGSEVSQSNLYFLKFPFSIYSGLPNELVDAFFFG